MNLKIKSSLVAVSLIAGLSFAGNQSISIKGSDTMVHLVSTWAEKYMASHKDVEISVTGGGSGTGIAALLNGTTDICAASRKIKGKELKLAEKKNITPVEHIVGKDGIAVVVNPKNPVSELEIEQIGKIYRGEITNWKQVGGPDKAIVVLSRESSSGTYVFFQEHVLMKKDYTPKARLMPATSAIVQAVSTDPYSIGYVGLGYAEKAADKIKALKVKADANSPAVAPSVATVVDGSYSISRALQLYTNGEPKGAVKSFMEYAKAAEGQKVVEETGYVPLIKEEVSKK